MGSASRAASGGSRTAGAGPRAPWASPPASPTPGRAPPLPRRALRDAQRTGLLRLFLLTETASEYYPRFGFRPIPREQAPPAVQSSVEFASACPVTAACLERRLA